MIEAFRPAIESELGSAISGHVKRADQAGNGRDIDDVSAFSGDHRGQRLMSTVHRAEIIDPDHVLDGLEISFDEGPAHPDSRVVDEDVDLAKIGYDLSDHTAHLFGVTHVTADHRRGRTEAAHFFQCIFQSWNGPAAAGDYCAARRQVDGQSLANSVGASGDQDHLAVEVHH